jgi:hypothetical protein
MTFTTRHEAVAYLVETGKPLAMAKVAINECFNQIPVPKDEDNDLLRIVTGPETTQVATASTEIVNQAYDEVIGCDFDCGDEGISIMGELKYDLKGDLIPPPAEQNAPSTEVTQ